MVSSVRRFISAKTGREFALNIDHVVSVSPGEKPETVVIDMVGKARLVWGSYHDVLLHIERGNATAEPPAAAPGSIVADDDDELPAGLDEDDA